MTSWRGPLNVLDMGAKGDGVTDDTDAIQAAINAVYERGGGTVFFPFTPHGYRIAKPAPEAVRGFPCRSQLYIPCEPSDVNQWRNVCLEGEMPVRQLCDYQMRAPKQCRNWPATEFPLRINNCVLFSDWEAPENTTDPNARPWSLVSILGGSEMPFGVENLTVRNLEFRVVLNTDKMYPTSTAANFKDTSRLIVEHCFFGLTRNVASYSEQKELKSNPCYCAGLIASADQSDHQSFRSVGVQGFKYGFVLGEMVVADYLYAANCEEAIVFHDCSHFSHVVHVVAHHNCKIVSALRQDTFGLSPSKKIYFRIDVVNFEQGGISPPDYTMTHGVYDPDDRMHARIGYHSGYPVSTAPFPVEGGRYVVLEKQV